MVRRLTCVAWQATTFCCAGRAQRERGQSSVSCRLLVVADATPEIANLGDEAHLGTRLCLARFREHVAYFVDLPVLCGLVDVSSERAAFGVFYRSHVLAQH